jgi:hypothetical protein
MVQALSGDKLFAAAHRMAAAISEIGGVTKLTAAEQQRANDLIGKAIEKYQALGKEAPTALKDIYEATTKADESSAHWFAEITSGVATGELLADALKEVAGWVKEVATALPEIALKGAAVAGVEENFRRLTAQAGLLAETLLTTLRAGTHDTIADFELMKTVNQDLAAGLRLTDAQFGVLSKGAFALARATGTDVKSALDTMNDAMLTGRTRSLALLTGKIDLQAAEERYAASIGVSEKELSGAGKLEAARAAILDAVAAATHRLGDQTDGLNIMATQAATTWANFEERLGVAIATSRVLGTGLDSLKTALEQTFGGSEAALIDAIKRKIDTVAIALVDLAKVGISVGADLAKEYYAVEKLFGDLTQIIEGDALAFEYLALGVAKAFNVATFGKAFQDDLKRINANIDSLLVSMSARGKALQEDDRAQKNVDATTQGYLKTLDDLKAKMIAARDAQEATAHETEVATEGLVGQERQLVKTVAAAEKGTSAVSRQAAAWQNLQDQFDGMSWDSTIDGALKLGGSVNEIATAFEVSEGTVKNHQARLKAWADLAKNEAELVSKKLSEALQSVGLITMGFTNVMGGIEANVHRGLPTFEVGLKIGNQPALKKNVEMVFDDAFRDLPNLFVKAFTGGGDFSGAFKALGVKITDGLFGGDGPMAGVTKKLTSLVTGATSFLGSSISTMLGSAIGGFLPGIGALLGPLFSAIGNIGGPSKEELSARDQQSALVKQLTANLSDAQAAQVALIAATHRGETTYATLAIAGRDALIKIGKSAAEADLVVQGLLDTHNPQRFAAAMKQVQDALNLDTKAQNALNDALGRYHFTTEQLGPALRAQKLDEQAQQLYQDWMVLNSAQIDTVAIGAQMAANVSEYLQTAMKTGTEVPIAMKPMLEQMARMGDLTDAAGNKLTEADVDGMNFATTMTQGFKDIVASVKELTYVIAKGLGVAIDEVTDKINNIPRDITVGVHVNQTEPNQTGTPGGGEDYGYGPQTPGYATGVRNAPGGWAIVGEDGPEAVKLPRGADVYSDLSNLPDFAFAPSLDSRFASLSPLMVSSDWNGPAAAAGGGSGGDVPVNVALTIQQHLNGRIVAEDVVSQIVQGKRGLGTILKRGLPA